MSTERNVTHAAADIIRSGNPAPTLESATVYAFGHSYLQGANGPWITRLIPRVGAVLGTNQSIPGTNCSSAAQVLLKLGYNCISQLVAGSLVILDSLINDAQVYELRGGSAGVNPYKNGLRAFLRAAQSGIQVDDTAGTYTGTWTAQTGKTGTYGGTYHSTVTQNDSVDITVTVPPSGVVTFILQSSDPYAGVTASADYLIKRGATTVASGSTAGQYLQDNQHLTPDNYGPFAVTLTGQPSGSRTYTLSKTDATGSILMFDCVLPESVRNAPGILLMKDPYVPAYQDSTIDLLRTAMDSVVAEFTTDFDGNGGNGITIVDPAATGAWDKATMVKNDGIHPNEFGAAFFAGCAVAAYANQSFWEGSGLHLMYKNGVYIPMPAGTQHVYTALKTLASGYVYSMDGTELPFVISGDCKLLITGGSGWKPGLYTVTGGQLNFNTGADGNHNLMQLSVTPAADGTAGGTGYPVRP